MLYTTVHGQKLMKIHKLRNSLDVEWCISTRTPEGALPEKPQKPRQWKVFPGPKAMISNIDKGIKGMNYIVRHKKAASLYCLACWMKFKFNRSAQQIHCRNVEFIPTPPNRCVVMLNLLLILFHEFKSGCWHQNEFQFYSAQFQSLQGFDTLNLNQL